MLGARLWVERRIVVKRLGEVECELAHTYVNRAELNRAINVLQKSVNKTLNSGDNCVKEADVTLLLPAHSGKFRNLELAWGGAVVRAVVSFGIVRLSPDTKWLPQRQFWVGKLRSRGAILTVSLMFYGEAALTVVCSYPLPELG
jgi:hypothetical protein